MANNPYSEAISRLFLIFLGAAGAALCAYVVWETFSAGATEGCFTRVCVSSKLWTAKDNPAQFWFYILFWSTVGGIFGRISWKVWRS